MISPIYGRMAFQPATVGLYLGTALGIDDMYDPPRPVEADVLSDTDSASWVSNRRRQETPSRW